MNVYDKLRKVLDSCETREQWAVALRYAELVEMQTDDIIAVHYIITDSNPCL